MNRRGFLAAILASGAAPAIVKAENIMPIFMRRESGLLAPTGEIASAYGFSELQHDQIVVALKQIIANLKAIGIIK